jgi:hypothetical protein
MRQAEMRNIVSTILTVALLLSFVRCDDREIDFIANTQFLFSATISDDYLIRNEFYNITIDTRLKDGVLENLTYRLDYTIEGGTGNLWANGFPFESGDVFSLEDTWTYQATSVGDQTIVLTLRDNTGASKSVSLPVSVDDYIPVEFSFNTNFSMEETFIQSEVDVLIELISDDPEMDYILNYEVMEGEGKLKNDQGIVLSENYPIEIGNTSWSYLPTKPGNNQLKIRINDINGDELTKNISVYVLDKIPFTVTAFVDPATVRMSKGSQVIVNVSSENPLFSTLSFTMQYASSYGDGMLLDENEAVLPKNFSFAIASGDNVFTYKPVVAGTHDISITVSDNLGNSEPAIVSIESKTLKGPVAKATASFELLNPNCTTSEYDNNIQECTAPLNLVVDLSGSFDQDNDFGGVIKTYNILINGVEYIGNYNASIPRITISNGVAEYAIIKGNESQKDYIDVKHGKNAAIRIELQDDDELWSEALTINAPGSYP